MEKTIAELRSVTCHVESHNITCRPTQVNAPRLNPSQTGWCSIYLPRKDGKLSWPWCWLYTWMVYLSADSHPSTYSNHLTVTDTGLTVIKCLHDRANIEQLTRRSIVISMLIMKAGGL